MPALLVRVHCCQATGRNTLPAAFAPLHHIGLPALQLLGEQLAAAQLQARVGEKEKLAGDLDEEVAAGAVPHRKAGIECSRGIDDWQQGH